LSYHVKTVSCVNSFRGTQCAVHHDVLHHQIAAGNAVRIRIKKHRPCSGKQIKTPDRLPWVGIPAEQCPAVWQTASPPPVLQLQQWHPSSSSAHCLFWPAHTPAAGGALHPRSAVGDTLGHLHHQSCRWRWCPSEHHIQTAPGFAAGCWMPVGSTCSPAWTDTAVGNLKLLFVMPCS